MGTQCTEDNNNGTNLDAADAATLTLSSGSLTLTGMSLCTDSDWYRVSVPEGTRAHVVLTTASADFGSGAVPGCRGCARPGEHL